MSLRGHPSNRKQREAEARRDAAEKNHQTAALNFAQEAPPSIESDELQRHSIPKVLTTPKIHHDRNLQKVDQLYNAGDWKGAIKTARYNLADPFLPRWHLIWNHLLWAHAADYYPETEEHRLIAERAYAECDRLSHSPSLAELEDLRTLRKELDALKEYQEEDFSQLTFASDLLYYWKDVGSEGDGEGGDHEGGCGSGSSPGAHGEASNQISRFSLSTNIPLATFPLRDIEYDPDDAEPIGAQGRLTRYIRDATIRESAMGGGVVSQGDLYAFARSFFRDPKLGIWWDPWTGQLRDARTAIYSAAELTEIKTYPGHPFAASIDCLDPMMYADGKVIMHDRRNASVMLLMFNYMKNSFPRIVLPLMGMAARQTSTERVKRVRGDVDWHDEIFWNWWMNAMAHAHFLTFTYPRNRTARFRTEIPTMPAQVQFATSMKTGRYPTGHNPTVRVTMTTKRYNPNLCLAIFPELQEDWFTARFIAMTDEIEDVTGVLVPRWGDTRLPWTFIESHQIPGEKDPAGWWKAFMCGYFYTARTLCDKKNETLVQTESPFTFGLLFVVDFCESGGYNDFIFTRMSPYTKSPLCASNGRLTTVAPGTPFATGFTRPWPSSFREHYDPSKRTMGPQPLIVNYLWGEFPRSMHGTIFDELCNLKEESDYCPAPAKDLAFLDYQQLVHVAGRTKRDDAILAIEEASEHDEDGADSDEEADEDDSNPRTSQERMQEMLSQFEADKLLDDPTVMECFDFMRQSILDDDEPVFHFLADSLVDYSDGGQAPPLQDYMVKRLEQQEVRVQYIGLELGDGFAAIGFRAQAHEKMREVKVAIHAKSLTQYYRLEAEMGAIIGAGQAELPARTDELVKAGRVAELISERGINQRNMEALRMQMEALTVRDRDIGEELERLGL